MAEQEKIYSKVLIFLYGQAMSIFINIVGCYQNNPSPAFSGKKCHLQSFEEITSGGVTF